MAHCNHRKIKLLLPEGRPKFIMVLKLLFTIDTRMFSIVLSWYQSTGAFLQLHSWSYQRNYVFIQRSVLITRDSCIFVAKRKDALQEQPCR